MKECEQMDDYSVGRLVKVLNTAIERNLNRKLDSVGLTGAQCIILFYLREYEDENICQRDIEKRFGLSHPTVSSILKRLKSKELIDTCPFDEDKRYKKVMIMDKGNLLCQEKQEELKQFEKKLICGISEEEKAFFIEIIFKMLKNISNTNQ